MSGFVPKPALPNAARNYSNRGVEPGAGAGAGAGAGCWRLSVFDRGICRQHALPHPIKKASDRGQLSNAQEK